MDIHERARVVANKSFMQQRHACIIVRNGKIVSEGYNHWMSQHQLCDKWSLHAEVVALNKIKNKPKWWIQECCMYVYRLSNTDPNSFRMSHPCPGCQRVIRESHIRKVYYTCDDSSLDDPSPDALPISSSKTSQACSTSFRRK